MPRKRGNKPMPEIQPPTKPENAKPEISDLHKFNVAWNELVALAKDNGWFLGIERISSDPKRPPYINKEGRACFQISLTPTISLDDKVTWSVPAKSGAFGAFKKGDSVRVKGKGDAIVKEVIASGGGEAPSYLLAADGFDFGPAPESELSKI